MIDVFEESKKLCFPPDEYMLVGSAIMAVKGIREAKDLDIIVSPELFERCKADGWELKPWTRTGRQGKPWLSRPGADIVVEITNEEGDFDLEYLKKGGEKIQGIWFMSLEQLMFMKRCYGRPRDFEDIAIIENYIAQHSNNR